MPIATQSRRRWGLTRREFDLAAAISLALLIGLLILDDASRGGKQRVALWPVVTRWEMHLDAGSIIVSNQPAWLASENAMDAQLADADKPRERAIGRLQRASDKGQFEEYRQANLAVKDVEREWIVNRQRILSRPRLARRSHDMPLWGLDLLAIILPVVWARRWLWTRPHVRREIIRPAGIISILLFLVTFGMLIATCRSYLVGARWSFPPHPVDEPVPFGKAGEIEWVVSAEAILARGHVVYVSEKSLWSSLRYHQVGWTYDRDGVDIDWSQGPLSATRADREWHLPGMGYAAREMRGVFQPYMRFAYVSTWLVLAAWIILTAPWWRYYARRLRTQRRRRANECLACGYSMSGNASGVCPECGTLARSIS